MKYFFAIPIAIATSVAIHIFASTAIWEIIWLAGLVAIMLIYLGPCESLGRKVAYLVAFVGIMAMFNAAAGDAVKTWGKRNFPFVFDKAPQARKGTDLYVGRILDSPNVEAITNLEHQKRDLEEQLAVALLNASDDKQKELVNAHTEKVLKINALIAKLERKAETPSVEKKPDTAPAPKQEVVKTAEPVKTSYIEPLTGVGKFKYCIKVGESTNWVKTPTGHNAHWDDGPFEIEFSHGKKMSSKDSIPSKDSYRMVNRSDKDLSGFIEVTKL